MFGKDQPLKRDDAYGVYRWWPEEGQDWIHPYDVPKAEDLIPSSRVLRRSDFDRQYSLLSYGELSIRVRPTLWLPVGHEGFSIGDVVEVCSQLGKNEPFITRIKEMNWNDNEKRIEYQVTRIGRSKLRRLFLAADLQHVKRLHRPLLDPEHRFYAQHQTPLARTIQ